MDAAHFEKTLSSEVLFEGRVVTLTKDVALLENGETSIREVVHHHGGACIVPYFEDGTLCMVRQFRYAMQQELWELPAGKLEKGEDPFEAAKRELGEECGLTADNYISLGQFFPTVGYDTEVIYTWVATGLHKTQMHLDADEFLTPDRVPLDKAYEMVMSGEIRDGKTIAGILKLKALIAEVGAADSTATAETAVQEGNFDHSQNPLFAVLNPRFAGGASIGAAYKADMAAVNEYLAQPAVRELFPADIMFKWGVKGDDKIDGRYYLYAIKVSTPDGKAPLDGSVVTSATEQYAQRGATAEVSMTMNAEGTQEWSRMTGENIGKCIAIVLDGYVYSAPRVNSKIDKGQSQITGDFTIQEAKDLANVLNSGKVPAPAKIIQDTVVGPSLGQESINAGMISFVIAFILVLLYMGLFYKTAGWMSDVALLTNVFLLMGVLLSF